jgi:glycerol-3-phosphate acyltransferase PlsX
MTKRIRIIVDALGGDNAPGATVEGAVAACRDFGADVLLVGHEDIIARELGRHDIAGLAIRVQHASEIVGMSDSPVDAFRKKKDSSISVGMRLLAEKQGDAFVSAGNSGAVVAAALFIVKRMPGIDRPAIGTLLPSLTGQALVVDAGANNVCKAHNIIQFALMGAVYYRAIMKCQNPRVGTLSNGEEDSKGTDVLKQVHSHLKKSSLNYIGYVEGKDVFQGNVDVVACDGFTGNIVLKIAEGVAESMGAAIKQELKRGLASKIGYLFSRSAFLRLKKRFDYAEYGGAPLLGINEPVLIAHGRSNAYAVRNMIRAAQEFSRQQVVKHILTDSDIHHDFETVARKPSLIDRLIHPLGS